ncbi:MAG TPA: ATP-binding cassette domain-containing protein [Symbiobacteriaceae bacterium]|jgi:tungstate transport system ATP-binding protein
MNNALVEVRDLIEVRDLTVRRGQKIVLSVPAFTVAAGEVLSVIGANGAGKSTLLQALALLLEAEMTYRFDGRPVSLQGEALALRRQMAVVFQQPLLLDTSVAENVALGLKLRHVPKPDIAGRVSTWLDRLGVAHLAKRHARALSGGEAQRVNLARALVLQPRVLFLDEPFGALDVLTRAALLQDLRAALRATGITALFVTHDFTEIPPLADRVAVMSNGRVVQTGTPVEIFTRPADDAVRSLVRAAADLLRPLEMETAGR